MNISKDSNKGVARSKASKAAMMTSTSRVSTIKATAVSMVASSAAVMISKTKIPTAAARLVVTEIASP
jgi:hypothetical protein